MAFAAENITETQFPVKVSFSARLIPALFYIVPGIGATLSALYLMRTLRLMKENQSAGIGAVFGALTESTFPVLVSLYLGVLLGIVIIIILAARMFMQTRTATPASWFFIICGLFFLAPAVLFAEAQSQIIEVMLYPREFSGGISSVASNLNLLLITSIAATLFVSIALLILSVVPLSAWKKPRWGPLLTAVVFELVLIAVTAAFQMRFLWLYTSGNSF